MREYKVKNKLFFVKKSKYYKQFVEGPQSNIKLNSNIIKYFKQQLNKFKMFNSVNELITFFIWEFEEKKGLYYYQKMKHYDELSVLKKMSVQYGRDMKHMEKSRNDWKLKHKKLKKENMFLKQINKKNNRLIEKWKKEHDL